MTERYLLPVLPELEAYFKAIRHEVDVVLHKVFQAKPGKPYPLGRCLEISLAAQERLRRGQLIAEGAVANGQSAFKAFLRASGAFRQVWGDLRGEYFQNAFQLGTLYVDVSNDTVTITKPKVEILPFDQAQFVPIRDYGHFQKIAASYWEEQSYPNHVLPGLAPYCPLIHVTPEGRIVLREATQYMLAMTRAQGFSPSETILLQPPMPTALFEQIVSLLENAGYSLPKDPAKGRRQALQNCRLYRAKRWHRLRERADQAIVATQDINRRLVSGQASSPMRKKTIEDLPVADLAPVSSTQELFPMPTINIDNQDYDLDQLSDDAKAQLASLQFVDQELARLQGQVAALQTARMAYANALKAALPK